MRRYGKAKNIQRWSLKESGFTASSPFVRTIKCIMDSDAKINGKLHTLTHITNFWTKGALKLWISSSFFFLLSSSASLRLFMCHRGPEKKRTSSFATAPRKREKSLREKSVRIILRALSNLMRWFHCANNFQTSSIAYNIPFFNSSFRSVFFALFGHDHRQGWQPACDAMSNQWKHSWCGLSVLPIHLSGAGDFVFS